MITDYQIEMLNVGDADAFVVYYITDGTRKHLVLIDAGSNMWYSCIRRIMSRHSENFYQDRTACFDINRKITDGSYWSKCHADLCIPCLDSRNLLLYSRSIRKSLLA